MKISELSQTSEIPVPTIKFYIREGLLPPGQRTAKNQADYGTLHLERLALIRALRDEGGLSIEVIARVLQAAAGSTKNEFVIAAVNALEHPVQVAVDPSSERYAAAERMLLEQTKLRGWHIKPDDGSLREAIKALAVVLGSFVPQDERDIDVYLNAAEQFAQHEIPDDWAVAAATPDAALRYAVLGTVLFEPLILALRRMAHVARTRTVGKRPRVSAKSTALKRLRE